MSEWIEVERFIGPKHELGPACVVVSKRGDEHSFSPGFLNGSTFRPQRYLPGNRLSELLDLLEQAEDKYGQ